MLERTYRTLVGDLRQAAFVTPAAEWFLDNFHLMASEMVEIRRHMPRRYNRELPAVVAREHHGAARIYALAVELLRYSDSRLDVPQLTHFLNSVQRVAPLTLGELWAWPSMLKLALVENLRRLSEAAAEFEHAPQACRRSYRMVVGRKRIAVEQGQAHLFRTYPKTRKLW